MRKVARFDVFVDHEITNLAETFREWLINVFPPEEVFYPTGDPFSDLSGLPAGVVGVVFDSACCTEADVSNGMNLGQAHLDVAVQRIYDNTDTTVRARIDEHLNGGAEELDLPIRMVMLPARHLMSTWKELVFEPELHNQIFSSLERTVRFMQPEQRDKNISARISLSKTFSGMVLLWGPPGSGKSTLCRALAQRLSTRFKDNFPYTILLEIDSHALHSKYFSESARLVQETFDRVGKLLEEDRPPLVCLLIDEVESLASSRENSSAAGGEPKDAMRALNALLTAIDRLRDHHSLLVFCTSNLVNAMDKAFLDRFDFKWMIPEPTLAARYEILRQKYTDLIESGFIKQGNIEPEATVESEDVVGPQDAVGQEASISCAFPLLDLLPPHPALILYVEAESHTIAHRLEALAKLAEKVSARSLCKMPWTSLVFHTGGGAVELPHALDALEKTLKSETAACLAATGSTPGGMGSTKINYG